MTHRHVIRTAGVGAICARAGGAAGIAGGYAKSTHHVAAKTRWGQFTAHDPQGEDESGPAEFFGRGWGGAGAIHSVSIETNAAGSFDTVTSDSGTITAVGSHSLTIKEGSGSATYATPTVTPAGKVIVVLDWQTSNFSALAVGDRVSVMQSSARTTTILATDSAAKSAPPGDWPGGWAGHKSATNDYPPFGG